MRAPFKLQQNEEVVIAFRKHWFVLLLRIAVIVSVTVLAFVAYGYVQTLGIVTETAQFMHAGLFLATWCLIISWWTLSITWMQYHLEYWIVTSHRVISVQQKGFFEREVTEWNIDRIQEIDVHIQNFIQALLGFGSIELYTPGIFDEHQRFTDIPYPEIVRDVIMSESSRIGLLEFANENQERLLHTVSHEVKSYLTKDAASFASIAEGDIQPSTPAVQNFAKTALQETRKGVSSLMDILSRADIKHGTLEIKHETFELEREISKLYESFKLNAQKKGLQMTYVPCEGACMVRGDSKLLLDLVYRNVIDNAIRYTQKGSVEIRLSKESKSAVCTISDTGIGISAADMQKLFTDGGHGEHSKDVNPESTGYGLSAAKNAIETFGGTIRAESKGAEKGSKFSITLPLAA